jgi:hypothetical protein
MGSGVESEVREELNRGYGAGYPGVDFLEQLGGLDHPAVAGGRTREDEPEQSATKPRAESRIARVLGARLRAARRW